jgi:pimeloyl-ACP methyl ester carboxylesterase
VSQHRYVNIRGFTGHYVEFGEGPPLVLLPSMYVLVKSYKRLIGLLAKRYRVVVVQMPGSGDGSVLRPTWSFQDYAGWAADFIRYKRLEEPVVIGHSNSGPVALLLARGWPELVSGIVLADSVGTHPSGSLFKILVGRAIDGAIETRLTLTAFHHLAGNFVFHTWNMINQLVQSAYTDLQPAAAEVTVPALLAWGYRDHTMPREGAWELLRLMPRSTLRFCRVGSHDWIITEPALFAGLVDRFVFGVPQVEAAREGREPVSSAG